MILDKRYFERKMMKSKEVEDVLGGADSWKNVDKTESEREHYGYTNGVLTMAKSTAEKTNATIAWHISDKFKFEVPTSL